MKKRVIMKKIMFFTVFTLAIFTGGNVAAEGVLTFESDFYYASLDERIQSGGWEYSEQSFVQNRDIEFRYRNPEDTIFGYVSGTGPSSETYYKADGYQYICIIDSRATGSVGGTGHLWSLRIGDEY